jgi:hypothetical protein
MFSRDRHVHARVNSGRGRVAWRRTYLNVSSAFLAQTSQSQRTANPLVWECMAVKQTPATLHINVPARQKQRSSLVHCDVAAAKFGTSSTRLKETYSKWNVKHKETEALFESTSVRIFIFLKKLRITGNYHQWWCAKSHKARPISSNIQV